jgi:hypothetical protein
MVEEAALLELLLLLLLPPSLAALVGELISASKGLRPRK